MFAENTSSSTISGQGSSIAQEVSQPNSTTQRVIWHVIVIQAVFCVYLCFALACFEHKVVNNSHKSHKKVRYLRWILNLAATTLVCFLGVTLASFPPFAKLQISERVCQCMIIMQKLSYFIAIYSIYMFLWLRQKLFYAAPSMRHLYTNKLKVISWTVLCITLLCFAAQVILSFLGAAFSESEDMPGCMPKEWLRKAQVQLGASCSTLVHVSLLMLFIYPLLRHHRATNLLTELQTELKKGAQENEEISKPNTLTGAFRNSFKKRTVSISSNHPERSRLRMYELIRRCTILTSCCVCVNLIANVFTTTMFLSQAKVAALFYSCNLLANLVCSVGFFKQWKIMLFPFCIKLTDGNSNESESYVSKHPRSPGRCSRSAIPDVNYSKVV
ncbi:unnamed protein product [Clavelina lepadiformis]|uniref:G-protein coupled receptors family 1 profile domain-containing protein n=1 Tax=Clavelina lepadiformis TaxID=159417 RepID=A0ABP0GNN8_CLALP